MKKLFFLLTAFAIVLSCSSDETSTPVTPPPAQIVKFTITLSAGEGGTVSTTGGEYEAGQTVSVTATPQGEYVFTSWSDGNTNPTRNIIVDATKTINANFEKRKYVLSLNFVGEGEVLEEIVNTGRTTEYESGTSVKLTALPSEEWVFVGWSGDIESTDNPIQISIGESKNITATFEKKKYPLTVNIEGEGQVIEEIVNAGKSTEYDSGTTVKLKAVPADGWDFVEWEGDLNGNSNPQQINIMDSKIVKAVFKENLQSEILALLYDKWNLKTTISKKVTSKSQQDFVIFTSANKFILNINEVERRGSYIIENNNIILEGLGNIKINEISENIINLNIDTSDFYVKNMLAYSDKSYSDGDCITFLECAENKTYSILSDGFYSALKETYQDEFFILKFMNNPKDWIEIYNNRRFAKILTLSDDVLPINLDFTSISYSEINDLDIPIYTECNQADWALFTNTNLVLRNNIIVDNYTILEKNLYDRISFSLTDNIGNQLAKIEISLNIDNTLKVQTTIDASLFDLPKDYTSSFYLKERTMTLPSEENICQVNDMSHHIIDEDLIITPLTYWHLLLTNWGFNELSNY